MPDSLRTRFRHAYSRSNASIEKHNGDGTVTIDSRTHLAFLEMRQMALQIETALFELEQLKGEKE